MKLRGEETDGRQIHAHHLISKTLNPDLEYNLSNGITLCVSCHKKVHRNPTEYPTLVIL